MSRTREIWGRKTEKNKFDFTPGSIQCWYKPSQITLVLDSIDPETRGFVLSVLVYFMLGYIQGFILACWMLIYPDFSHSILCSPTFELIWIFWKHHQPTMGKCQVSSAVHVWAPPRKEIFPKIFVRLLINFSFNVSVAKKVFHKHSCSSFNEASMFYHKSNSHKDPLVPLLF